MHLSFHELSVMSPEFWLAVITLAVKKKSKRPAGKLPSFR
jgi:hypothetical protein